MICTHMVYLPVFSKGHVAAAWPPGGSLSLSLSLSCPPDDVLVCMFSRPRACDHVALTATWHMAAQSPEKKPEMDSSRE